MIAEEASKQASPMETFAGGWGMPSLRRMFDVEPALRYESSFRVPSPAVDVSEDDAGYKVTAELPGMGEKETRGEGRLSKHKSTAPP